METERLEELVLQSLEHERGAVGLYETALRCVQNPELKREWETYLEETRTHVAALEVASEALGLDARRGSPGRAAVKQTVRGLAETMRRALDGGDPVVAELVACECLVLVETKNHRDWGLLHRCAPHLNAAAAAAITEMYPVIKDQQDEHLYYTGGWCRELWREALGLQAVLPPPEKRHHARSAIGAARAEIAEDGSR